MKKLVIILITPLFLVSTYAISQNSNSKSIPEFFKLIYEGPEYIYGNVKEIHCETYDAIEQNGKIVLLGKMLANNSWEHQICTYLLNPKGEITQMNVTNMAGKFIGIFNYLEGKLENIYWLEGDTLKYNWDYTYPKNDIIMRNSFDLQYNKLEGVFIYDIDNNGLIMNQVYKNEKGEQEGNTVVYKRENNGMISDKKVLTPDGKIMQHYDLWNYDDNGNKNKIHRTVLQGEKVDFYGATHTYEYDDKGNWIKRTSIYPDNNNIRVTVRKFVFY